MFYYYTGDVSPVFQQLILQYILCYLNNVPFPHLFKTDVVSWRSMRRQRLAVWVHRDATADSSVPTDIL
jgi:hypothetical protein